jgi:hypothetical protein
MISPLVVHAAGAFNIVLVMYAYSFAWRGRVVLTTFERLIATVAFLGGSYDLFCVLYLLFENRNAVLGQRMNNGWGVGLSLCSNLPVFLAFIALMHRGKRESGTLHARQKSPE